MSSRHDHPIMALLGIFDLVIVGKDLTNFAGMS